MRWYSGAVCADEHARRGDAEKRESCERAEGGGAPGPGAVVLRDRDHLLPPKVCEKEYLPENWSR